MPRLLFACLVLGLTSTIATPLPECTVPCTNDQIAAGVDTDTCILQGTTRERSGCQGYSEPPPLNGGNGCFPEAEREAKDPSKIITLEYNNWLSQQVTTAAARILLEEKMGYTVRYMHATAAAPPHGAYYRAAANVTDANLELWPGGKEEGYNEWITNKGLTEDGGTIGVVGRSGWYAPRPNSLAAPSVYWDYYREYQQDSIVGMLPHGAASTGTTPRTYNLRGPPASTVDLALCDEPYCTHGQYFPPQCNVQADGTSDCHDFYHIFPGWDKGWNEALIKNNNLKLTVTYLGDSFKPVAKDRLAHNETFIYYYWEPDPFNLVMGSDRVSFKGNTAECTASHSADPTRSNVDCDYPQQLLQKIFNTNLKEREPRAYQLLKAFSLDNDDIDDLMAFSSDAGGPYSSPDDAACAWTKAKFQDRLLSLIPPKSLCEKGNFLNSSAPVDALGRHPCHACPPGTYTDSWESTSCQTCPSGTFSVGGQSQCIPCSTPGTFSGPGAASCSLCPPGTSSSGFASACTPCPRHSFQEFLGQGECRSCPIGDFTMGLGSTSCTACGAGGVFDPRLDRCVCKEGFYGEHSANGTQVSCQICPRGGICCDCDLIDFGESKNISDAAAELRLLRLKEDHFLATGSPCSKCVRGPTEPTPIPGYVASKKDNVHGAERPSDVQGTVLVACHDVDACAGGPLNTCGLGYTGVRCGECDTGYFNIGERCHECPGAVGFLSFCLIAMPFVVTLGVLDLSCRQSQHTGLALLNNLSAILFLFQGISFAWPEELQIVFNVAGLLNLDLELFAPDCNFRKIVVDKWAALLLWACLPPLFVIIHGFSFTICRCIKNLFPSFCDKLDKRQAEYALSGFALRRLVAKETTTDDLRHIHLASLLRILTIIYPIMVEKNLGFFKCVEIEDRSSRVFVDPSLNCGGEEWNTALPIAIFNLIVYIFGMPLAMGYYLVRNRDVIHARSHYPVWWPVLVDYTKEAYYWGIVDISLVFVVYSSTVVFSRSLEQATCVSLALVIFMVWSVYEKPFKFDAENVMTFFTGFVLQFTVFMGIIAQEEDSNRSACGIAATTLVCCVLAMIVAYLLFEYWSKYKEYQLLLAQRDKVSLPDVDEATPGARKRRPSLVSQMSQQFLFQANRRKIFQEIQTLRSGTTTPVSKLTPQSSFASNAPTQPEGHGEAKPKRTQIFPSSSAVAPAPLDLPASRSFLEIPNVSETTGTTNSSSGGGIVTPHGEAASFANLRVPISPSLDATLSALEKDFVTAKVNSNPFEDSDED